MSLENHPTQLKAMIFTLGCKVNYYEGEALREQFRKDGFVVVEEVELADVCVINSCAVTGQAVRKCRQLVRRLKKANPEAFIAVAGCYPQADPEEAASLAEVDLVAGAAEKLLLPGLIKKKAAGDGVPGKDYVRLFAPAQKLAFEDMPWTPEQGRARAFLKIQDGCEQFCTFCTIPLVRGPLRSLPPERGMYYLQQMGASGFREVVLTGIHLGLFGTDLTSPTSLASFLQAAVAVDGIERIRLSSLEPSDIREDLIKIMADNEKICRHLHIPLQSGDDLILQKMGRPYGTEYYSDLLKRLTAEIPDLAVSTDLMVGFPGESEANFQQSLDFVRSSAFSRLHVFKFSPRNGTPAAEMTPQIRLAEKERRSREMISLGEELSRLYQEKFLGRIFPVLLEKEKTSLQEERGPWEGLTSNYLRVQVEIAAPGDWRGKIVNVLLEESCNGYLKGTLLN